MGTLGGEVSVGLSAGGSVGVGGKGMGDSGTPLARLGCLGEEEAGVEGLLAGDVEGLMLGDVAALEVGEVPERQRLQVAAQYPPAGAPAVNMKSALHLPYAAYTK